MTINIGHLYRKKTVRNLAGQVVDMVDETDGGVIISKGRVMNEEKVIELNKKQKDRETAAQAFTVNHDAPEAVREERTVAPSKMQEIEKRVEAQDAKLDAILKLLSKDESK